MSKVGVVVPVLNNFFGFFEFAESIKSQHHEVHLYIQHQWKQQVPLAASWNNGLRQAYADDCDYVLVSNDDIMLAPDTLDNMVFELNRLQSEKVVLISCNNILGEIGDYHNILTYQASLADPLIADNPSYACFMVAANFFDIHGTFDENFRPAWCEDNDSHYRIHLLGYRGICTTAAPSIHHGGVTTRKLASVNSSPSQQYFAKKWGSFNRNMKENFTTPYNNPELTPRDWIPQ